jgi:hypothetical protein
MNEKYNKKVISRRNAGLGDNLFAAAHAWYYAKKTNRKLVINWAPSMYLSDKSANAFPFFFEVPDYIEGVPIISEDKVNSIKRFLRRLPLIPYRYFLPVLFAETVHKLLRKKTPDFLLRFIENRRKWSIDLIKNGIDIRNKTMIFNSHYGFLLQETKPFFDALKLKTEFQSIVDNFSENNLQGKTVIGLHIKYYDKTMPKSNHTQYWLEPQASLNQIKDKINGIISRIKGANYVIYLATDSAIVQDFLRGHFKNVVSFNKGFKIEYTQSQHLKLTDDAVTAALVEMFLLAKSDILYRFPPSGSWFSHYGSLYAKETII